MAVVRAPRGTLTVGAAAIGERRPNPLFGRQHEMDRAEHTAEKDGIYELADGTPVRIKAGEPLPLGATFRGERADLPESPRRRERRLIAEAAGAEERARGAAPENRARTAPAEKEAK